MAVEPQIIAGLDRWAFGRQTSGGAFGTGTDFWHLADASAIPAYENIVKGQQLTDLDTDLGTGITAANAARAAWFQLHATYFSSLGLTTGPLLGSYLSTYSGKRCPYWAAECHYDAIRQRLATAQVFPKGILVADAADPTNAGMHLFGTLTGPTTWAAGDGALVNALGAVVAINMGAAQTVAGTFACVGLTATKNLSLSLSTAAQYTQTILGIQAIGSSAAAGQKVVTVAATAQFAAGEWVMLYADDDNQELCQIDTISANTSLTMKTNLVNTFASGSVWPLFVSASYASGGSGTGAVNLYARPDRIVTAG